MNETLNFFTVYTLVDITCTGVIRAANGQEFERNQQRNWETVLQVFGIRSQPIYVENPTVTEIDVACLNFGENYNGVCRVWHTCIGIEHADVYKIKDDPLAGLVEDFKNVPIICNLKETAKFSPCIFLCSGQSKNIYFKLGKYGLNTIDATHNSGT